MHQGEWRQWWADRVLFIGNSLTYFNDLPGTVARLASSVNATIEVASVAAALVMYEGITGQDARSLPAQAIVGGRTLSVPESRVRLLQGVAHETVTRALRE